MANGLQLRAFFAILAVSKRNAIRLPSLEAARQALHSISAVELSSIPETNGARLAEVILMARATADSIDVSKLLLAIRSAAVVEAAKLASSGPLGFGYEQFRGAFLEFHQVTERERNAAKLRSASELCPDIARRSSATRFKALDS